METDEYRVWRLNKALDLTEVMCACAVHLQIFTVSSPGQECTVAASVKYKMTTSALTYSAPAPVRRLRTKARMYAFVVDI